MAPIEGETVEEIPSTTTTTTDTIKHLSTNAGTLVNQIVPLNSIVTGQDDESYTRTFVPAMASSLYAETLETYDASLNDIDGTFDVSIQIPGKTGSASYFSTNFIFLVDNGLNGTGDFDPSTYEDLSSTDVLYLMTLNSTSTDFASLIFGESNDFQSIYVDSSANTISGSTSVNIATEYVNRVADFLFNDYRSTSLFTNSNAVLFQLNDDVTNSNSILYAINSTFSSLNTTNIQQYNTVQYSAALILQNLLTTQISRFTDSSDPLVRVTNTTNSTAYTKISTSTEYPNRVGYHYPFKAGDILQFGVTINVPTTQYNAWSSGAGGIYDPEGGSSSTTAFRALKVLATLTLA